MRNPFAKPKRVAERDCHAYPFADAERDGDALPPADPYTLDLVHAAAEQLADNAADSFADAYADAFQLTRAERDDIARAFRLVIREPNGADAIAAAVERAYSSAD